MQNVRSYFKEDGKRKHLSPDKAWIWQGDGMITSKTRILFFKVKYWICRDMFLILKYPSAIGCRQN